MRLAILATVVLGACGRNAPIPPPAPPPADAAPAATESCQALARRAGESLSPVLDAAGADPSCQTDDDCLMVSSDTACTASCGTLVNRRGAAMIEAGITRINAEVCVAFVQQ